MRSVASVVVTLPFVFACSSIESEDIKTSGMSPDMVARSNAQEPNSTLTVSIRVNNSALTFVDLDGEDKLSMTVGGATTELNEQNLLGIVSYSGSIPGNAPGTEVTVALARGAEDDPAPASTVTFTDPITLVSPGAGASFSRANDDIVVSWDSGPSDDAVKVTYTGTCIQGGERAVQAADTSVTLERGSILKREQGENEEEPVPDSCDISISAVRTRTGTLDDAFGGGGIRHEFSASATATTNP